MALTYILEYCLILHVHVPDKKYLTYMKIHVPSMLAIGIQTINNKQAATMDYKIH